MKTLTIVIPAYNEEKRLPRTFELLSRAIAENVFQLVDLKSILVIDDGSNDQTLSISEAGKTLLPQLKVISVKPNQGKGNAIHTGLTATETDWCLIADADSATPWNQFIRLFQKCYQNDDQIAAIAIGSRDLPESELEQKESWIRETLGKTVNLAVRLLTGLPFRDTQCGFKLIHIPSAKVFFPSLQVKRFAWDVEFLMFAKSWKLKTIEVPVMWSHQEGSRISTLKDGMEMVFRVIEMRLRLWLRK